MRNSTLVSHSFFFLTITHTSFFSFFATLLFLNTFENIFLCMKANELSLNDLNFIKLEEHFRNEFELQNENETQIKNENHFGNETSRRNENELGIGNENISRNETGNEPRNENQTGNETISENELITQMKTEILFYSNIDFSIPQQTIPNPRIPQNHFQVIVVGKTNIKELWERYYHTTEFFMLQEYLTELEIEDFKLASSRFNILNQILLRYQELENIKPVFTETEDEISVEIGNEPKWYEKIDFFGLNMLLLLLIPILVLVLIIIYTFT